jgi:hypothetical protein
MVERRPVTIVATAAPKMRLGLVAFFGVPKDIFPSGDIPEIKLA